MHEFPASVNIKVWENYLHRMLNEKEVDILLNAKCENSMNKRLKTLWGNALSKELHIPILTELDGNCLFNSLIYHGIGNSVESLRNMVSYMLYNFRHNKELLYGTDLNESFMLEVTLGMSHPDTFEPPYVKSKVTKKLHKYEYDHMCQAVTMDGCWSIVPANMVMILISRLFNIEFRILSTKSNDQEQYTTFSAYDSLPEEERPPLRTIYLGHIHENHYVPLDHIVTCLDQDLLDKCPQYVDDKLRFIRWAKLMEKRLKNKQNKYHTDGNYYDDQGDLPSYSDVASRTRHGVAYNSHHTDSSVTEYEEPVVDMPYEYTGGSMMGSDPSYFSQFY
jgi:hypothetical protein